MSESNGDVIDEADELEQPTAAPSQLPLELSDDDESAESGEAREVEIEVDTDLVVDEDAFVARMRSDVRACCMYVRKRVSDLLTDEDLEVLVADKLDLALASKQLRAELRSGIFVATDASRGKVVTEHAGAEAEQAAQLEAELAALDGTQAVRTGELESESDIDDDDGGGFEGELNDRQLAVLEVTFPNFNHSDTIVDDLPPGEHVDETKNMRINVEEAMTEEEEMARAKLAFEAKEQSRKQRKLARLEEARVRHANATLFTKFEAEAELKRAVADCEDEYEEDDFVAPDGDEESEPGAQLKQHVEAVAAECSAQRDKSTTPLDHTTVKRKSAAGLLALKRKKIE